MADGIEEREVALAQQRWADGIVEIGKALLENRDDRPQGYRAIAKRLVDDLYGYQEGTVLFKPTKARDKQFRLDSESALSYFVGGNPDYPEDTGFALRPWTDVRFENAGFLLGADRAVAMGNYYFADETGSEIKVEYTLGFFKASGGGLKINLHHSSLPYR